MKEVPAYFSNIGAKLFFDSLTSLRSVSLFSFSSLYISFSTMYSFIFRNTSFSFSILISLRSEEHTSELQSRQYLVCRLLLEKKKKKYTYTSNQYVKYDYIFFLLLLILYIKLIVNLLRLLHPS